MERPVLDPTFIHEGPPRAPTRWADRLQPARALFAWCGRLMLRDVFGRGPGLTIEVGTSAGRFVRGLCYRMLFLPLVVALIASALVYNGTHPPALGSVLDPTCHGIYYDPVSFAGEDRTPLEGWLVPVLDAKRVLAERERALT